MRPRSFAVNLTGLLYVTSAGISVTEAALVVSEMAGRFRLPDALKLADRLARGTGAE